MSYSRFEQLPPIDDAAIPTQFFQDDFDDGPGFDDGFDAVLGLPEGQDEEELLAATQGQSRRVRPPTVNYAKRAKRVDVKRLKDNIWKGLDIVTPHAKKEDGMVSVLFKSWGHLPMVVL